MNINMFYWRFTYWLRTKREKLVMWFIRKLPKWIIYRSFIRLWAHGTSGKYGATSPDDLTWQEALNRWEE